MALVIKSVIHNKKSVGRNTIIPKKLQPPDLSILRKLVIMATQQKPIAKTQGESILNHLELELIGLDWSIGIF